MPHGSSPLALRQPPLGVTAACGSYLHAHETTHLVVKRGHRGRYRLTLLHDGVRLSGDVTLDQAEIPFDGRSRKSNDAAALSRLRNAVLILAQKLEVVRVKP